MKFNCVVFAGAVRLNEGTKVVEYSNDVSLFELSLHVIDTSYLYVPSLRLVHTTDEFALDGALGLVTTCTVLVGVAVGVEVFVAVGVMVFVGVGVAGTATTFNEVVSPVTVAYCPHSQQVPPLLLGISITQ